MSKTTDNSKVTSFAPMASTDAELECNTVILKAITLPYTWPMNSEVEPGTRLTTSLKKEPFMYRCTQIDCRSRIAQTQGLMNAH